MNKYIKMHKVKNAGIKPCIFTYGQVIIGSRVFRNKKTYKTNKAWGMNNMKKYKVAVVGATGAVGTKMIQMLHERNFPFESLKLLSSVRSAGKKINYAGKEYIVEEATPDSFEGIEIALFSAGGSVSAKLAPEAVKRGALVIDNTSYFRMDKEVPLVVPEVNPEDIFLNKGIIANPNCSTIQMVVALKPLHDLYKIKRVVVSTYQAVSGTGWKAVEELRTQNKELSEGKEVTVKVYPKQIANNALPHIDVFEANGYTKEEMKMVNETKKIFHDNNIQVTPTCVRVPVENGHSESVYIETEKAFTLEEARGVLENAEGVVVQDNPNNNEYPLATEASGKGEVFVGRLRKDLFQPNGLNMWITADNLLKGAAYNAVQIAEIYIKGQ